MIYVWRQPSSPSPLSFDPRFHLLPGGLLHYTRSISSSERPRAAEALWARGRPSGWGRPGSEGRAPNACAILVVVFEGTLSGWLKKEQLKRKPIG